MLMKISLQNLGKRFNREWIFRHLSYEFISQRSYAITGPNGSGKSTLLQVIGGASTLSEGKIMYENIKAEDTYKHVSIAAPYLELVEEMTLTEFLNFHSALKQWLPAVTVKKNYLRNRIRRSRSQANTLFQQRHEAKSKISAGNF